MSLDHFGNICPSLQIYRESKNTDTEKVYMNYALDKKLLVIVCAKKKSVSSERWFPENDGKDFEQREDFHSLNKGMISSCSLLLTA